MRRASIVLLTCALIAGCRVDHIDVTPAQYEQAKTDCAAHGGLLSAQSELHLPGADRIVADCFDGVRVTRTTDPKEKLHGQP